MCPCIFLYVCIYMYVHCVFLCVCLVCVYVVHVHVCICGSVGICVCMCVFLCVSIYLCICMCVFLCVSCVYLCVGCAHRGHRRTSNVLLHHSRSHPLETGFLTESGAKLAGSQEPSSYLPSQPHLSAAFRQTRHLYTCWDLNTLRSQSKHPSPVSHISSSSVKLFNAGRPFVLRSR